MPVSLLSFSTALADIVEAASPAVVAVHARPRFHSSGVHWTPGLIVTAEHALHSDDEVTVTSGAERYPTEIAGRDPGTDLAVLRIKSEHKLPVAPRADGTNPLRPGSLVIAIGRNTESANADLGIVGSIGGPSHTRRGGRLDAVVRLNLALHPVAAGGAVVDATGQLIGVATPALSSVAVFAVPNATVDRVVRAIMEHGGVRQGYLGAGLQPVALPEHLIEKLALKSSTGLMTVSIDQDAAAGRAGLVIGDILLEWNGEPVGRPEALRPLLAEAVAKTASVRILRGGEIANLEVKITERKRSR